jgi:hypothetical protein
MRLLNWIKSRKCNAVVAMSRGVAKRQDPVTKLPSILPPRYNHVNTVFELSPPAGR